MSAIFIPLLILLISDLIIFYTVPFREKGIPRRIYISVSLLVRIRRYFWRNNLFNKELIHSIGGEYKKYKIKSIFFYITKEEFCISDKKFSKFKISFTNPIL